MGGIKGMRRLNHKNTARDRVWNSIRRLREFTVPSLCRTASADETNVKSYLVFLRRHQIVRRAGTYKTGHAGHFQKYQLIKDLGPSRPIICPRCKQPLTAKTCKEKDHE